ncbi:MAG: hypothetical protein SVU69_00290 [Pseudomonadota bacterium]|nr:hypothetical protein [Pseudomonadota bacterium]
MKLFVFVVFFASDELGGLTRYVTPWLKEFVIVGPVPSVSDLELSTLKAKERLSGLMVESGMYLLGAVTAVRDCEASVGGDRCESDLEWSSNCAE